MEEGREDTDYQVEMRTLEVISGHPHGPKSNTGGRDIRDKLCLSHILPRVHLCATKN